MPRGGVRLRLARGGAVQDRRRTVTDLRPTLDGRKYDTSYQSGSSRWLFSTECQGVGFVCGWPAVGPFRTADERSRTCGPPWMGENMTPRINLGHHAGYFRLNARGWGSSAAGPRWGRSGPQTNGHGPAAHPGWAKI